MIEHGKVTQYDSKRNVLAIYTDAIMPDLKGVTGRKMSRLIDEAFSLSYAERIERYASESTKAEIKEMMDKHPGCNISEYMHG